MHNPFFNSLKQLEKRLKLENHHPVSPVVSPVEENNTKNTQQTDSSIGTPLYLIDNHPTSSSTSTEEESEIPREFLSNSPDFPLELQLQQTVEIHDERPSLDDEIETLMQLLGLSDPDKTLPHFDSGFEDGFYGNIVGVKCPKSRNEVNRLDGWINHYLNGEEKKEPFRLAHLLLGKAAFLHSVSDDCDDSFKEIEFPSTVANFLQNDPPLS